MGPGKHLKGLELAGGLIKPEEVCSALNSNLAVSDNSFTSNLQFDYFHEVKFNATL
jgi:hypothetical protein